MRDADLPSHNGNSPTWRASSARPRPPPGCRSWRTAWTSQVVAFVTLQPKRAITDTLLQSTAAQQRGRVCRHLRRSAGAKVSKALLCGAPTTTPAADRSLPPRSILDTLQANVQTNLIGPVATVQAFLPLLRRGRGKKIWFTSAIAASQGGWPGAKPVCASYAVSKVGLNMWSLKLARALEPEGFTVLAFHPGLVKTDMTVSAVQEGAAVHGLTAEESAKGLLEMLATKGPADSFKFWDVTGEEIPF